MSRFAAAAVLTALLALAACGSTTTASDDTGAATAVTRPQLGSVADPGELQARVRENFIAGGDAAQRSTAVSESEQPPSEGASDRRTCAGLAATGDQARGTQVFVADADLAGDPVRVHVYDQDGQRRLVATDHACSDVVDQPYTG